MSRVRWANKILSDKTGQSLSSFLSSSSNRLHHGNRVTIKNVESISYTDISDIHTLNETNQFPKNANDYWSAKAAFAAINWEADFTYNAESWRKGYTHHDAARTTNPQHNKRIFESRSPNLQVQLAWNGINTLQKQFAGEGGDVYAIGTEDTVFNATYPYRGPEYQKAIIPVIPGQTLYFAGVGGAGGSMPSSAGTNYRRLGGNGAWAVGKITVPDDVYHLSVVYGGGGETVTKSVNGNEHIIARGGYPGGGDSGAPQQIVNRGSSTDGYGYYACAGGGYTAIWTGTGEINIGNVLVILGGGGGAGVYPTAINSTFSAPSGGYIPPGSYYAAGKSAIDNGAAPLTGDNVGGGGELVSGGTGYNRNVSFTYNNATDGSAFQGGHGEGSDFDSGGGGGGGYKGGGGGMGGGGVSSTSGGGGSSWADPNYVEIVYSSNTQEYRGVSVTSTAEDGNVSSPFPMMQLIQSIGYCNVSQPGNGTFSTEWYNNTVNKPSWEYSLDNFFSDGINFSADRNTLRSGHTGDATWIGGGSDGYLALWDVTAIGEISPEFSVDAYTIHDGANNTVMESSADDADKTIQVKITTRNVPLGSDVYLNWSGVTDADFTAPLPTSVTLDTNPKTFNIIVTPDTSTEGTETGTVTLGATDSTGTPTGSPSATLPAIIDNSIETVGQFVYTSPGTYNWTCPADVTSVHVVCIGGGGGGRFSRTTSTGGERNTCGGGGGGLIWANNLSVTPGQQYQVIVGAGGAGGTLATQVSGYDSGSSGGSSRFTYNGGNYINATGGQGGGSGGANGGSWTSQGLSGTRGVDYDYNYGGGTPGSFYDGGGGGGAAGYSGNGGTGGISAGGSGEDGQGGGGGGGGCAEYQNSGGLDRFGGDGGGVGSTGEGPSGAGAAGIPADLLDQTGSNGGSGSYGNHGRGGGGDMRAYFGGAASASPGTSGAVRIRWGANMTFPTYKSPTI